VVVSALRFSLPYHPPDGRRGLRTGRRRDPGAIGIRRRSDRPRGGRRLTHEKGFPASYDVDALVAFLRSLRAGSAGVRVPVYSHESYDVVPDVGRELVDAAVVIVEGVNALQFRDHLDLGVYVDAPEAAIERWYADRLVGMFAAAPRGSFYAELGFDETQQREFAHQVWSGINHPNLMEHILPTRERAEIVVEKGPDHAVQRVRFAAGA
jgi:type I pantothenate kinase